MPAPLPAVACSCPGHIRDCAADLETCLRAIQKTCSQAACELPVLTQEEWKGEAAEMYERKLKSMAAVLSATEDDVSRLFVTVEGAIS